MVVAFERDLKAYVWFDFGRLTRIMLRFDAIELQDPEENWYYNGQTAYYNMDYSVYNNPNGYYFLDTSVSTQVTVKSSRPESLDDYFKMFIRYLDLQPIVLFA